MAKEEKKAAPAAEKSEFKYGVSDLVESTGLQEASVRVALRASGFTRAGRSWGWNSKKEFDEVLAYFKERSSRKPDMTAANEAKAKKAAARGDAKPTRKREKADA